MTQHSITPPPTLSVQTPLVLVKAKEVYQVWHKNLVNLSRLDRYTLGARTDDAFLFFLELIFRASFAHDKFEKLSLVSQAASKGDILKFFLQLGWEQKIISYTHYGNFILSLDEIGRMLGGWKRSLQEKTPAR
jgi:hypothetical protein